MLPPMKNLLKMWLVVSMLFVATTAKAQTPDARYIEDMLVSWTHQSHEAMRPWAEAMANVCVGKDECDRLASQAFVETRFVPWAVDQSCNDRSWRESRKGWECKACDSGLAFGPWQVHDERFRGAAPDFQASVVLELMRHHPEMWTTWRAARSHAAWWRLQTGP
jgi:hypothetical protein